MIVKIVRWTSIPPGKKNSVVVPDDCPVAAAPARSTPSHDEQRGRSTPYHDELQRPLCVHDIAVPILCIEKPALVQHSTTTPQIEHTFPVLLLAVKLPHSASHTQHDHRDENHSDVSESNDPIFSNSWKSSSAPPCLAFSHHRLKCGGTSSGVGGAPPVCTSCCPPPGEDVVEPTTSSRADNEAPVEERGGPAARPGPPVAAEPEPAKAVCTGTASSRDTGRRTSKA